jgi:hypothetical protein
VAEFALRESEDWRENCLVMETLHFDLLFFGGGDSAPSAAIVQVKSSGAQTYAGEKYEDLISAECLSATELDGQIDLLHRELEEVRKKGRLKFAKAA